MSEHSASQPDHVEICISAEADSALRAALDLYGAETDDVTQLVEEALWDKIRELRDRHNQGRPFPPLPTDEGTTT